MSETREAYNVTLQPGPELDALVAKVMGWTISELDGAFMPSTNSTAAMLAWEWLGKNHPWSEDTVFLGLETNAWEGIYEQPAVFRYIDYGELGPICVGQTYPHAISLAVVEAGKVKQTLTPIDSTNLLT